MTFNTKSYREVVSYIEINTKKNVKIVAISKFHPKSSVEKAISFGVRNFGENRVQEAQNKFSELKKQYSDIELHLTGPLQTNKVKNALSIFDVFQTLDRPKLAKEFCKFDKLIVGKKFFIQVNIGQETNKSGVLPNDALDFIKFCTKDCKLHVVGLMCIPPVNKNPKEYFLSLKDLAKKSEIKELSMGMSADYKIAVDVGTSCIRVGTNFFGQRL